LKERFLYPAALWLFMPFIYLFNVLIFYSPFSRGDPTCQREVCERKKIPSETHSNTQDVVEHIPNSWVLFLYFSAQMVILSLCKCPVGFFLFPRLTYLLTHFCFQSMPQQVKHHILTPLLPYCPDKPAASLV